MQNKGSRVIRQIEENAMDHIALLEQIKARYAALLQANLVGIYVHGSVAFDCFHWASSDIDYIVVVDRPLSLDLKNELMKETLRLNAAAPQKGLEMSVVLREHCMNFAYPTPFELHFSNTHQETMNGVDKDLAAHFTVIKHRGLALCGEPIDSVFGDIPKECYLDSIQADIQGAKDGVRYDPVYYILNLCRVLAYQRDGLILSKEQGGNWGLEHLDCRFHSVIRAALDGYVSGGAVVVDGNEAVEFCESMLDRIFA